MRINQVFLSLIALTVVASLAGSPSNSYADAEPIEQVKSHFQAIDIYGPDFNGDGFADIAVGAPGSFYSGYMGAGSVSALYGPFLTSSVNQLFHQGTSGVPGINERNDYWGESTTYGDFDGDGYHDLVVAAPREDRGQIVDTGSIWVIPGSNSGLKPRLSRSFHQGSDGMPGINEENDYWGRALAAGDFNGDSYSDLMVGAPNKSFGNSSDVGSVVVLYGSPLGLTSADSIDFHQDSIGVPGGNESGDLWGSSLVSADFDNDGFDDVIIGAPGEAIGSKENAGAFTIMFGSSAGLVSDRAKLFHQGTPGVPGGVEDGDRWAETLAAGDFNDDGFYDLAVGSPHESIGTKVYSGAITILYGSQGGLGANISKLLHQGSRSMVGANEPFDKWGSVIESGDYDEMVLTLR